MISESLRQNREDYRPNKEAERSMISQDIDTFLANGGRIDTIPTGLTTYDFTGKNKHAWSHRTVQEITKRQGAGRRRIGK